MPKLTSIPGGKAEEAKARPRPKPKARQANQDPPEQVTDLLGALEESAKSTRTQIQEEAAEERAQILADVEPKTPRPKRAKRPTRHSTPEPEAEQPEGDDETPTEAPPEPEGDEDAPEAGEAKKDATEGEGKAKRPKPKRRPPAAVAKPIRAQAFTPDLSKLQPLEDKPEYLRVMLYGDSGVGKTTAVASLAHRGRVAIVDPENSVRPKALRKHGIPTENLLVWTDWSHGGLEQFFVTIKAELEREPGSIFAVVIDTMTALAQFLLEEAVQTSLATPAMMKKHPDRSPLDVFQDDYGTLTEMIRSTVTRHLFQLPCHVVLTAHARRGENENGQVRIGPALPPAAQQAVTIYSDWVLYMTREEAKGDETRLIRSMPKGQIEAKDRYGVLAMVEKDQSLLDLLEKWEEAEA